MNTGLFFERSWCHIDYDVTLANWVKHALPAARKTVTSPDHTQWLRCGGTWFAGVNALPNDNDGTVAGSGPLRGIAVDFVREQLGITQFIWDQGQVSVCYPGYPQPMPSETSAAFRYRRDRDAAHIDGLLPEGERRRRHLREHHGFILGLPMLEFEPDASPFIVWEGSHEIVRKAFVERFDGLPAEQWGDEDVTAVYHQTRREVFETCSRVKVSARPGEAFVVHRLALHGVAPWAETASAGEDGRMICYFRPDYRGPLGWLSAP